MKNIVRFRLIGEKTPVSFQIPLRGMMIEKKVNGRSVGLKKVVYIPGAPSIWKEDYEGDEEERQLWMEDGILDIQRGDFNALEILKRHPWFGVKFEIQDEEADAFKELEHLELVEKALQRVNISQEDELRATAVVLLGSGVISWGENRVKAGLKKLAYDKPETVLQEMDAVDYHSKYISALAHMKGVILLNPSRTAVTWEDGKVIVKVATGQDPLRKLAEFLADSTEEATTTLQEIGERIKRKYERKIEDTGEEKIEAMLAEKEAQMSLEQAREVYAEKLGKAVPANMKNNLEWILSKLEE